jgi:transcriptional regulator with XRE-family HTH domain
MAAIDLKTLFGAAIRNQRSVLGISQGEFASRAGLHRTYVSDVQRATAACVWAEAKPDAGATFYFAIPKVKL